MVTLVDLHLIAVGLVVGLYNLHEPIYHYVMPDLERHASDLALSIPSDAIHSSSFQIQSFLSPLELKPTRGVLIVL